MKCDLMEEKALTRTRSTSGGIIRRNLRNASMTATAFDGSVAKLRDRLGTVLSEPP